jgi:hypothetical protein
MNGLARRKAILEELLALRSPLDESLGTLATLAWDSEAELATLDREHAVGLINRFLSGMVSSDDLEQWANAIEGRDDIAFVIRDGHLLQESVFELANPLLTEPLTRDRAEYWRVRLEPRD